MIDIEVTPAQAKAAGLRALAGPFADDNPNEVILAAGIIAHITATGGRCAIVRDKSDKWIIFRPRSEMENSEQTERRLGRLALRGQ